MNRVISAVMRLPLLLPAMLLFASATLAAPTDGLLSRLLTPEEFARAGLAKLSPAELSALEAALSTHSLPLAVKAVPPPAKPAPAAVRQPAAPDLGAEQVATTAAAVDTAAEVRTNIEGTLEGYSGRAIFRLANGQIWQLRNSETASFATKLVNPEVVITRGFAGYKMLIVAADRIAYVKRLQ